MEHETKQGLMHIDVSAYVGDNVRKIRYRMRKAKYGCTVVD